MSVGHKDKKSSTELSKLYFQEKLTEQTDLIFASNDGM